MVRLNGKKKKRKKGMSSHDKLSLYLSQQTLEMEEREEQRDDFEIRLLMRNFKYQRKTKSK